MPRKKAPSPNEQTIRVMCDELDRCHIRYPDLRVEGFASMRRFGASEIGKVWDVVFANHANLDADVVVIPERWRRTANDQYAYRFFGDVSGCNDFMHIEKEVQGILDIPDADARGGSGVFLAGAVGLRCGLPLLDVRLHNGLPDHSERFEGVIEGFDPTARLKEPGYFRLELVRDPFLSLKIALEWVSNPIQPKDVLDGWKVLMGHLPYSYYVENLLGSSTTSSKSNGTRSWTQHDLDEAILEYKARRASSYMELVQNVAKGCEGARIAARRMFGRNAVARELGVKAPAMVSRSPAWIAIAEGLGIQRKPNGQAMKPRKIGIHRAVECASDVRSCDAQIELVRREIVDEIRRTVRDDEGHALAKIMIAAYESGKLTEERISEMLEKYQRQKGDPKFHQSLLSALQKYSTT